MFWWILVVIWVGGAELIAERTRRGLRQRPGTQDVSKVIDTTIQLADWPKIRRMENAVWGHAWYDHGSWRSTAQAKENYPGEWVPCRRPSGTGHMASPHGNWAADKHAATTTWCIACQKMVSFSTWDTHRDHSQEALKERRDHEVL